MKKQQPVFSEDKVQDFFGFDLIFDPVYNDFYIGSWSRWLNNFQVIRTLATSKGLVSYVARHVDVPERKLWERVNQIMEG